MIQGWLAGAACAMALSACAHEGAAPGDEVTVSMTAARSAGRVVVRMHFENRTDHPVWVPAAVAQDEELLRREFDVTAGGARIAYTGPMVKRGPLTADDYVRLAPHASLDHALDITQAYAWKPGPEHYTLDWEGHWLPDVARLADTRRLAATASLLR
jgi:hypothetical protein